jgi:acylpyruvate hydrolase
MRIVTFERNGIVQHGIRDGETVQLCPTAKSAVDLALNGTPQPGETVALSEVKLLPPVPRPGKVICIGLNYRAHAIEGRNPIPDYPAVFIRCNTSLAAPGAPLIYPECSDKLDYEAELAVVVGKRATAVHAADALDYVAGYSCFNDGSVRDYQRKSTQWTMGKNFDGTGGFGPDLVTPDELPTGASGLRLVARLNGEVMQDSNTSDMIFDVATLIATLSEGMTLEPGDVIATGTPSGVGYARTPPVFMKPGDVIEIDIERIGVLTNTIAPRGART